MSQLHLWLVAAILAIELGIATDVPFVFDDNSSKLAGFDSKQLQEASASSRDLEGVPPVSSLDNDEIIKIAISKNDSANASSSDNKTKESQSILSGFAALNQSSESNSTISSERLETDLQPAYSMVELPIVTSTNQDYWFKEGNKNYNNSNYQEAVECYDQAIELNSQSKEIWCNKGIALCRLGKYQDALDAFDQATGICPDYSKAWRSKGHALKAMGREAEAEQAFQKAG